MPFYVGLYCRDSADIASLNEFECCISHACMPAAEVTIPVTSDRGSKGRVPGWKEFVEPVRSKSLFWRNISLEYGKPKTGAVVDSMRHSRATYHYAIRNVRRNEQTIVNELFSEAILANHNRDLWAEVKRICGGGVGQGE